MDSREKDNKKQSMECTIDCEKQNCPLINERRSGQDRRKKDIGRPEGDRRKGPRRKGDKPASEFVGIGRKKNALGAMQDMFAPVFSLPAVGTYVMVVDVMLFERPRLNSENDEKQRYKLVPHPGTISESGEQKIYVVDSYTHGIEKNMHMANKVVLKCVYPKQCEYNRIRQPLTVNTSWIVTGSTRLFEIEERKVNIMLDNF